MRTEIIMIGSELLLGQVLDTNSLFLARALNEAGIDLYFKSTVGDNARRLDQVLQISLGRSHIIITSGGLGPTDDDITREAVARVTGRPLVFWPELWSRIEEKFRRFGAAITENSKKQAQIPKGAAPLANSLGSAPGFMLPLDDKAIFCLPGVPRELERMVSDLVIPQIRREFGISGLILSRTLKIAGTSEGSVGEIVADLMARGNPTVGTLVTGGAVQLRITAKAEGREEAQRLIGEVEAEIRARLGRLIFGVEDETIEGVVGGLLKHFNIRLGLVETVTGGLVAHRLVSAGFGAEVEGLVASGDVAQSRLLASIAPDASALRDPEALAGALARAAREWTRADLGLALILSGGRLLAVISRGERSKLFEVGGRPIADISWQRLCSLLLDKLRLYIMDEMGGEG